MELKAIELNSSCSNIHPIKVLKFEQSKNFKKGEIIGQSVGAMFGGFGGNSVVEADYYYGTDKDTKYLLVVRGTAINRYLIQEIDEKEITLKNGSTLIFENEAKA